MIGTTQIYRSVRILNHTGAHKINHCMAAVLAKLRAKKIIVETGAGQHGVALATAAAYFHRCDIYMGEVEIVTSS